MKSLPKNIAQDNIRVAIRIRPPLEHELKEGNTFDKLKVD